MDSSAPFVKLGTRYGGWCLPAGFSLGPDDVCYLAGAGEDISFDYALARRFSCRIHVFDPTPKAAAHFKEMHRAVTMGRKFPVNNSGSEYYEPDGAAIDRIRFHPWGIAAENGECRFYAPANPDHVSHSIVNLQKTEEYFTAKCMNFRTICQKLKHDRIALIKIDIEGAEYQVIQDLAANGPLPGVLLVEFDEYFNQMDGQAVKRVMTALETLQGVGMRMVHIDQANVTFMQ